MRRKTRVFPTWNDLISLFSSKSRIGCLRHLLGDSDLVRDLQDAHVLVGPGGPEDLDLLGVQPEQTLEPFIHRRGVSELDELSGLPVEDEVPHLDSLLDHAGLHGDPHLDERAEDQLGAGDDLLLAEEDEALVALDDGGDVLRVKRRVDADQSSRPPALPGFTLWRSAG